jgi:glycosyltransferase involved in cell wall biosynthesis
MKLSIIVPVYNLENYIAATLESLLSIRFSSDYEIVVINDGSMDRSESVIRDYQQKHSQIVLYTIENQGVSNARNLGIARARGEYITFLDGDDTVEPDFFEKAVQELDGGDYDFVQGNYTKIDRNRKFHYQYTDKDKEICDNKYMMELFFAPDKKIHNTVWGKVFRAEAIQGVVFDKTLAIAEDQKFVFDVLSISKKIKLLKDEGVNYYFRDSSAMHTMNEKKIADQLAVVAYYNEHVSYPEIKVFIQRHELYILLNLYVRYTKARNHLSDGIREEILKLNFDSIKPYLDKKTIVIVNLLKNSRFIYDIYIWCFSRYKI